MASPSRKHVIPAWALWLHKHRALIVPLAFISLLVVVIVPMPPVLMDVLIAINISVAVIMLMTTMYTEQPLDFSVFPSLLLGTTLMRLVLNVASTRLILTADAATPDQAIGVAGKVISAFGSFVAGGSLFVGIVIFVILIVVQFVVITKGATRISEVAARFTLDAMPGKQMAIDADLNAGLITEEQARARRETIAREADFFGAMDGASKFVRGDAIAGIIITVVNIVGGFAVGAIEKGWDLGQTAEVFTILTIGDGIASQVPSFIIAIASALIVTRSGAKQNLGVEMTGQLTARPSALFITAGFLALLGLTPLPATPMFMLAGALALSGWFIIKDGKQQVEIKREAAAAEAAAAPQDQPVEELLKVDALELEVGFGLVALVDQGQGGDLLERISATRRQLAADTGFVMPPVRIRDNMTLAPNAYRFRIRGNTVAQGELAPGMLLAMDSGITTGPINGVKTREPAFGLDAWWIERSLKDRAESLNYTVVEPSVVLTTHLAETVRVYADELLSREEVNNLVAQLKQQAPKLVEEVVPSIVTAGELQKVLQSLLRERVPIRDLESVVETLAEWGKKTKDPDVLVEYARHALRRTISHQHAVASETLPSRRPGSKVAPLRIICVTLDPAFEDAVNGYVERGQAGTVLNMPAGVASMLASRVRDALRPVIDGGHAPIIIASPQVRAPIRQILEPFIPGVIVLGYNEIVAGIEVESMGLVSIPEEQGVPA